MLLFTLKKSSLIEGKKMEKTIINGVTKVICNNIIKASPKVSSSTMYILTEE